MEGYELLTGTARKLAVTLTTEADEAPTWYRAGVRDVTSDVFGALETVDTARGELARIADDPNTSDKLKAERLAETLRRTEAAARSYTATAQGHVSGLKARLDKELIPARPEGVSDALLLDVKHDLAAILDRETTPDRATEAAVKLAQAALADGNGLAFHALAGGPMHLVYARHGIDRAALAERFAALNPAPAAKLRARFRGPESVPALHTLAVNAVDMGLTDLQDRYGKAVEALNARAAKAPVIR